MDASSYGLAALSVGSQMDHDESTDGSSSGSFTWRIPRFRDLLLSELGKEKLYSDDFQAAGHSWRLLIIPRASENNNLSFFLDIPNAPELPKPWSRWTTFVLKLLHPLHPPYQKDTTHTFGDQVAGTDWGFTKFISHTELMDAVKGYLLPDGGLEVQVDILVRKDPGFILYDARAETGCVGLKNQGATCYMNSLLQTLYHIGLFRRAVYEMPTTSEESVENSMPVAMQQLFWKLQYSNKAVSTKALTKTFGWTDADAFDQHDVQELNRILCEKLESKMKHSHVEKSLQQLFEGHTLNYIECINVDYKSTRKESFMDLQLDVKGCKNVTESLLKFCESELLQGDNKYSAEQHGLQDARKGTLFVDFPPVLQLHLKRFEYDFERDMVVKYNGRYEFPTTLNLEAIRDRILAPSSDVRIQNVYRLHSVLVHTGSGHGGHYFAYIRPNGKQWLKFDDDKVTLEKTRQAVEEQFGEVDDVNFYATNRLAKFSNAYMLVYIRESDWPSIMDNAGEECLQDEMRLKFQREEEDKEARLKLKAESHLYCNIQWMSDVDVRQQVGKEVYFDLAANFHAARIKRDESLLGLRNQVLQMTGGGGGGGGRVFVMWTQANDTVRPKEVLSEEDLGLSLNELLGQTTSDGVPRIQKRDGQVIRLYFQLPPESLPPLPPLPALPPLTIGKHDHVFFVKYYDPMSSTLSYLGPMSLHQNLPLSSLVQQKLGLDVTKYALYEEVKWSPSVMVTSLALEQTPKSLKLTPVGDILILQPKVLVEEKDVRFTNVKDYLVYMHQRRSIEFKPVAEDEVSVATMELLGSDGVEAMSLRLCELLHVPMHHVQLFLNKSYALKSRDRRSLDDLNTSCLYYRILDMPLADYEVLKHHHVCYYEHNELMHEFDQVAVHQDGTVGDLMDQVIKRLNHVDPASSASRTKMRLLVVQRARIVRILHAHQPLTELSFLLDAELRVEAIVDEHDLVQVVHVSPNLGRQHSQPPFLMSLPKKELVHDTRKRMKAEFAQYKLGIFHLLNNKFDALEEDGVVDPSLLSDTVCLALEHADVSVNRRQHYHQHGNGREKVLRIGGV